MTDDELDQLLAALPYFSPAPGFADRVMARLSVSDPFALTSLRNVPRRVLGSRRSLALAASIAIVVVGSMAASIAWTLANQPMLVAFGEWLVAASGELAWDGLRGLASSLIAQPGYASLRELAAHPVPLALASALASMLYLGGIVMLRRLLSLPDQRVAHVRG